MKDDDVIKEELRVAIQESYDYGANGQDDQGFGQTKGG